MQEKGRVFCLPYPSLIPPLSLSYPSLIPPLYVSFRIGRETVVGESRLWGECEANGGVNGKTLRFRVPVFKFRLPLQMGI